MNNDIIPKSTKGMGRTYGQSGTQIFKGYITAEEYNKALIGKAAIRIFDIMRRSDATAHAILQACKLPILGLNFDVQAASDDERDQYHARYVKNQLFERNNFDVFLNGGLTMLDYGFSVYEKTFDLTEFEGQARLGLADLGFRKQVSIDKWETEDGKPGVVQQLVDKRVSIPRPKLVLFSNQREGDNYEGISLLRFAYKDWDIKDKLTLVNAVGLEKQAVGVPLLTPPTNASEPQKDKARDILRNLRANEEGYIEKPEGWEIEFMDMKGNTTKEVIPTINYHERQMKLSILAQFLDLGAQGASGSRAVSEDHSKLFYLSEEAIVRNLVGTIQEEIVKQLCDLNFNDMPNGYPKLIVGKVADEDISTMSDAIQKLMNAGALQANFETEQHLRKKMHLPELTEEDRQLYEERQKQHAEMERLALEAKNEPDDLKKEEKVDPKKAKEDKSLKASILNDAKNLERRIINVLYED